MKLPDSVKIGPFAYPIELKEKVVGQNGEDLWGHWHSFPRQYIEIKDGVSAERQLSIFLHEALHGIDESWEVGLKEKQIRRLGIGLTAFLRDNCLLHPDLESD